MLDGIVAVQHLRLQENVRRARVKARRIFEKGKYKKTVITEITKIDSNSREQIYDKKYIWIVQKIKMLALKNRNVRKAVLQLKDGHMDPREFKEFITLYLPYIEFIDPYYMKSMISAYTNIQCTKAIEPPVYRVPLEPTFLPPQAVELWAQVKETISKPAGGDDPFPQDIVWFVDYSNFDSNCDDSYDDRDCDDSYGKIEIGEGGEVYSSPSLWRKVEKRGGNKHSRPSSFRATAIAWLPGSDD